MDCRRSNQTADCSRAGIRKALAVEAGRRRGTIHDIEHIVVMMQENRPFDQYFGTLRGVRGFNDPRAVDLPNGDPVLAQPDGANTVFPFNPPDPQPGLTFYEDVAHGWNDSHGAWNDGKYDAWIANKGRAAMIHCKRPNIPFHDALADAFTVCNWYFCSVRGPTDPNRYYIWTGWLGQGGSNDPDSANSGATPGTFTLRPGGDGVLPFGPVTDNAEEGLWLEVLTGAADTSRRVVEGLSGPGPRSDGGAVLGLRKP